MGTIYLIHFDAPYKHARHYIGWTNDLARRLTRHTVGRGARLMDVVTKAGIYWNVVRIWSGSRKKERAIKNGHAVHHCPVCKAQKVISLYYEDRQ